MWANFLFPLCFYYIHCFNWLLLKTFTIDFLLENNIFCLKFQSDPSCENVGKTVTISVNHPKFTNGRHGSTSHDRHKPITFCGVGLGNKRWTRYALVTVWLSTARYLYTAVCNGQLWCITWNLYLNSGELEVILSRMLFSWFRYSLWSAELSCSQFKQFKQCSQWSRRLPSKINNPLIYLKFSFHQNAYS